MPEPTPPRRPHPMVSGDALDRLIDAIGSVTEEVRDLSKKIDVCSKETQKTNASVRTIREELTNRIVDVEELVTATARTIRRHDSGFRQASEADAKQASDQAALVIALDDTRKLAKRCLEKVDALEKSQNTNAIETAAQTPMLSKIDDQTKSMTAPTKAAALLNFAIGLVYLASKVVEWLGHIGHH